MYIITVLSFIYNMIFHYFHVWLIFSDGYTGCKLLQYIRTYVCNYLTMYICILYYVCCELKLCLLYKMLNVIQHNLLSWTHTFTVHMCNHRLYMSYSCAAYSRHICWSHIMPVVGMLFSVLWHANQLFNEYIYMLKYIC